MSRTALDSFPTYRLHQIAKLSDLVSAAAYQNEVGISLSEGRCLAAIGQFAPLSVQDLARLANLDKANASRAAVTLQAKGWVSKATNPQDARGVVLALSPSGQRLWRKTMKLIARRNAEIFGCLEAEELALFNRSLDKIVAHLVKLPDTALYPPLSRHFEAST